MNYKTIRNKWKKAAALGLAAIMTLSLAACGKGRPSDANVASQGTEVGTGGFVYVPEYDTLPASGENSNINIMEVSDGYLYYVLYNWNESEGVSTKEYYKKKLGSSDPAEKMMIELAENRDVMTFTSSEDGIYYFLSDYSSSEVDEFGNMKGKYFMVKYDNEGNQVFEQEISEQVNQAEFNNYVQYAQVDGEGRIYASSGQNIWLYDAEGNSNGEISLSEWINGMCRGKDGKIYISQYSQNGDGYLLYELDYNTKALGQKYENFPGYGSFEAGGEKDFLVSDSSRLYAYDMATQSYEVVLEWLDSDISGDTVNSITALEDGRIAVVLRNYGNNIVTTDIAYLTKTDSSQVAQKQVVTVGNLYNDQALQQMAVNFNKSNDKYRIKIKTYVDENNWNENSYTDGITAMNNDITSANGPDIINLSYGGSLQTYVSKGLVEDLNSYLDSSTKIKREDFLETILNAYTFDGVLVSIPTTFSVQTVLGKTSMVGEEMGWSIEDLMKLADSHPEAEIFEYASKESMLSYLMMFNQESFIDAKTGECHFDSDGFRQLLEFSNRFPKSEEISYDENSKSMDAKIRDNELLLNNLGVYDVSDFVIQMEIFGEPVTAIGYPTVDDSVGCMLNSQNGILGISSKSSNKEGAWEFLEYTLTREASENGRYRFGFSTRTDLLNELFEKEKEITYVTDENGEKMLDENGEPIKQSKGGMGWGDVIYEYYGATQEQIDMLKEIIAVAKPKASNDNQIMNIINEEAASFFSGQKSVDEVVNIIQNRVQIYVSESN